MREFLFILVYFIVEIKCGCNEPKILEHGKWIRLECPCRLSIPTEIIIWEHRPANKENYQQLWNSNNSPYRYTNVGHRFKYIDLPSSMNNGEIKCSIYDKLNKKITSSNSQSLQLKMEKKIRNEPNLHNNTTDKPLPFLVPDIEELGFDPFKLPNTYDPSKEPMEIRVLKNSKLWSKINNLPAELHSYYLNELKKKIKGKSFKESNQLLEELFNEIHVTQFPSTTTSNQSFKTTPQITEQKFPTPKVRRKFSSTTVSTTTITTTTTTTTTITTTITSSSTTTTILIATRLWTTDIIEQFSIDNSMRKNPNRRKFIENPMVTRSNTKEGRLESSITNNEISKTKNIIRNIVGNVHHDRAKFDEITRSSSISPEKKNQLLVGKLPESTFVQLVNDRQKDIKKLNSNKKIYETLWFLITITVIGTVLLLSIIVAIILTKKKVNSTYKWSPIPNSNSAKILRNRSIPTLKGVTDYSQCESLSIKSSLNSPKETYISTSSSIERPLQPKDMKITKQTYENP
ncbi:hypothetical protein SNEBB_008375, partial [Seison nebaliae]